MFNGNDYPHIPWTLSKENEEFIEYYRAIEFYEMNQGLKRQVQLTNEKYRQLITSLFNDKLSPQPSSKLKLIVLSGHDQTIATYLAGFNWFQQQAPPYAAQVLLELFVEDGIPFFSIRYDKEYIPSG